MYAIFKHEGEVNGEAVGPVELSEYHPFLPDPNRPQPTLMGRPYRNVCTCRAPSPDDPQAPESTCTVCGGQVTRWLTRTEAEAFAEANNADLLEV